MTVKYFILAIAVMLCSSPAFGDRTLSREEILQIFQRLTSQPRKTWINTGTIEATHEEYRAPKITDPNEIKRLVKEQIQQYQDNTNKKELTEDLQKMHLDAIPFNVQYKLSNEYTMNTSAIVKVDGERFYWEINVESRTDSIKAGIDLTGNFMLNQFDLNGNKKRVFAWDGQNYTTYSLPTNRAVVDSRGNIPHVVNGPLTAGVIPWGFGTYTYTSLISMDSSAEEKTIDGQSRIYLTLNNSEGLRLFVFDAAKDYSVVSYQITKPNNPIILQQYSGYHFVSNKWVPAAILIEQHDALTNKLSGSDLWQLTMVSDEPPASDSFKIQFEKDASIEYFSPLSNEPLIYQQPSLLDAEALLAERLEYIANDGVQPQNCATAAMQYAVSRLKSNVPDEQFSRLVNQTDGKTSLYAMKRFAEDLGLYCRAVKTDVTTLKTLQNCQVILHIPGKNHFINLASIDSDYVWAVDFAHNKFLYNTEVSFFNMDWTAETALVISNQPINGEFTDIGDEELQNISGSGIGYTCTRLLQNYNVIFCDNPFPGVCGGMYQVFFNKYGCESAPQGYCNTSIQIRYSETPCIEDPNNPASCTVTGDWTNYFMRACM